MRIFRLYCPVPILIVSINAFVEESDDDDEPPSRRRRMAERAAEGGEDGAEDEVGRCFVILNFTAYMLKLYIAFCW